MINNKRVLIVVPARGGSKGIKLKNIRTINGKPLIAIVGDVVKEIRVADRIIVSTDNKEIAKVALDSGIDVPFYRPESISGDKIGDVDVLTHALHEIEKLDNLKYDIIVMLQPTSPMRKSSHVISAIKKLIETNADSVWTVSETDAKGNPLKQLIFDSEFNIDFYDPLGANIIARQELKPTYHKNGVAYVMTRECLLEKRSIQGRKCIAHVIEEIVTNIDTELDMAFTEFLLQNNLDVK